MSVSGRMNDNEFYYCFFQRRSNTENILYCTSTSITSIQKEETSNPQINHKYRESKNFNGKLYLKQVSVNKIDKIYRPKFHQANVSL